MAARRGKKPKVTEQEAQRNLSLTLKKWDTFASLVRTTIITVGVVAGLFVSIALPIYYSHGEETTINYVAKVLSDINLTTALPWVGTLASAGWAMRERGKRLGERKDKDERIRKLEVIRDPDRSSSRLDAGGTKEIPEEIP